MSMNSDIVRKTMEKVEEKIRQEKERTDLQTVKNFTELILNNNYRMIGEYVYANQDMTDSLALAAVSICRRRFKRKDIVVLNVLDVDVEGESGIVFTEDKLYCWEVDEEYKGEVAYVDIEDVDYGDDSLTIFTKSGDELNIYCGIDFIEHNRYMYNFLMDIKEYAETINA